MNILLLKELPSVSFMLFGGVFNSFHLEPIAFLFSLPP